MNNSKKVLITGAAGYIGSVLTPRLLEQGHEVVAIDNFMYGQTSLLSSCSNPNFTIIRGDARDEELIKKSLHRVDYIIPLACLTGAPLCSKDTIAAKAINLEAINLILKLRDKNQKIIYPTTNSGYGIGEKGIYCDENTSLRPVSLYGQLKVEAEKNILEAGNAITLRLATVFGASPRMRLDLLVNDFVYRAVNDRFIILFEAHFKRNYVHIRDVVDAFMFCIDNFDKMKDQTYNLGLDEANLSKMELCQEIKKQVPEFVFLESEIGKDPDKRDYIVSNAKINNAGFKANISLEEGIAELKKTYQIIKRNQFSNV